MTNSVAFNIGNLAVIDKVDAYLGGYFERVFGGIEGRMKDFVPLVKLLVYNKLGTSVSANRVPDYSNELCRMLGFKKLPKERSVYRAIERVGMGFAFVLQRHQEAIKEHGLVTKEQIIDFSSTYFEGKADLVGEYGYSRDGLPGKKQFVFGISTGINNIPTALTIQRGNVLDKKHFPFMLRTAGAILEPGSLLIFDCGANTKKNKQRIRKMGFNYLTLKQKKRGPYKAVINEFRKVKRPSFKLKDRTYQYAKFKHGDEYHYMYYSEKLYQDQIGIKRSKLTKELEKNERLYRRILKGKPLAKYPCKSGIIVAHGSLQKYIDDKYNPHITGIEGYFILESSVDASPKKILLLYKNRDKAEKLIRNIKEGTDLRPIRHWTPKAIRGYVLIVFLANFLINLTINQAKNPVAKNVKVLKKILMKLTVVVVYPQKGFRYHILANDTQEIRSILGNYIDKYHDKTLKLRW